MGFVEYFVGFWPWPLILMLFGLGLVILEMFIPDFGLSGIVGIVMLIAGIILKAKSVFEGIILGIIAMAILLLAFVLVLRSAQGGRLYRSPLILKREERPEEGYTTNEDLQYFVGHEGMTLTILRPAGMGEFDGVKLDVVSESEFIDRGKPIRIIKVEGRRIVVRQIV